MFTWLSLELLLIVGIILVYTRVRKTTIFSLQMVKDLNIYMPPSQADFDVLIESVTPVTQRENAKGKKNKFDARKAKN